MRRDVPLPADDIVMLGPSPDLLVMTHGAYRKGETKYPFNDLDVLAGFDVKRAMSSVRAAVSRFKKLNPEKRFVVRKTAQAGWTRVIRVK